MRGSGNQLRARVSAAPRPLDVVAPIQLALVDIEAAPYGERWVYRATCYLQHDRDSKLQFWLPSGSVLEALAVDGKIVTSTSPSKGIAVPLTEEPGFQKVQMVWSRTDAVAETPRFECGNKEIRPASTLWTLLSSPGNRLTIDGSLSAAAINLRRAEALLLAAAPLNLNGTSDATVLASQAARWLRLADISLAGSRNPERSPNGQSLTEWSSSLREQLDALRLKQKLKPSDSAQVENDEWLADQLPFADAFETGIPTRWSVMPDVERPTELHFRLTSSSASIAAVVQLFLFISATMLFGLLMFASPRRARLEQVAFIGLLGAIAFGIPDGFIFIPLIVVALFARLWQLGRRLFRRHGTSSADTIGQRA